MRRSSIQLEKFTLGPKESFKVEDRFRLSDFYFWHFHPEIELVYINAEKGIRHVGTHRSEYHDGDLVLIGSDIPHTNFDYQQKSDYVMIVVHMMSDFHRQLAVGSPELLPLSQLLRLSIHGVTFSTETQKIVAPMLRKLTGLTGFKRYSYLLNILHELSLDEDYVLLHEHPYESNYIWKEQYLLNDLYRYIDAHYMRRISLSEASSICHLSKEAFCRYFKKATNQTFIQFLNGYRIARAKRAMLSDNNLTDIAFDCGFESLAYFSRVFKQITGQSPSSYRRELLA